MKDIQYDMQVLTHVQYLFLSMPKFQVAFDLEFLGRLFMGELYMSLEISLFPQGLKF